MSGFTKRNDKLIVLKLNLSNGLKSGFKKINKNKRGFENMRMVYENEKKYKINRYDCMIKLLDLDMISNYLYFGLGIENKLEENGVMFSYRGIVEHDDVENFVSDICGKIFDISDFEDITYEINNWQQEVHIKIN